MQEIIKENIGSPVALESLYQEDKSNFKKGFNDVFEDIKENQIAQVWNERLNYKQADISFGSNTELMFIVLASLIAGFLAKLPMLTDIDDDFYFQRNVGFILLPVLTTYFSWKRGISLKSILSMAAISIAALVYINLLPDNNGSDTIILACIHLPLFLWSILGYSFLGGDRSSVIKRIEFLRYNGDMVVLTALILIAGILMTMLTFGLFSIIDVDINDFYFKWVVVFGLASAPIVATYIIQSNPSLVRKVSPTIAKIFSPLVLITVFSYLIALVFKGKDPFCL
jgi:hypothetical protein